MDRSEFYELPRLAPSFPVSFRNGVRWSSLTGTCGKCGSEIPHGELRGSVSRPLSSVYVVEALGLCGRCDTLTEFRYRLHEDASISGVSPATGEWSVWAPRRPWWRSALSWLGL